MEIERAEHLEKKERMNRIKEQYLQVVNLKNEENADILDEDFKEEDLS